MKLFSPPTAFGIDISDFALRLISLEKRGKKIRISSFNEVKVPQGIIINGVIKDNEKITHLTNQLINTVKGKKITKKEVISVLPETKTFIKLIEVKNVEKDKQQEKVQDELKKHIPLEIDDIYFDWQIISNQNSKLQVLAGVAPKNIVDSYLTLLRKLNLVPLALEIEAAAISRALLAEDDHKSKVVIDIGAARTGLTIFDHNTVQFTSSLPISGNDITQKISQTLDLDHKKAEKAKFVCGLDKTKCKGALRKILFGTMDNLIVEINKSISYYKGHFNKPTDISEIVLCGGGANFQKIDIYLSHRLNVPVVSGNPLRLIEKDNLKQIKFPISKSLSYTTAIGLALRGIHKDNI